VGGPLVWLLLVGAGAHRTPGRRTPSAQVRADIAAAETAERARKHDVARQRYQQAVARASDPPSIAYARHEYAETLMSWGEVPEAIAQLEGVIAVMPDSASAWHDLGILRHNQGDDARALQALERARDLAPRDPRPRIALAALRWTRGDKAGASTEYRALLELDLPDRVRAKVSWALTELVAQAGFRAVKSALLPTMKAALFALLALPVLASVAETPAARALFSHQTVARRRAVAPAWRISR